MARLLLGLFLAVLVLAQFGGKDDAPEAPSAARTVAAPPTVVPRMTEQEALAEGRRVVFTNLDLALQEIVKPDAVHYGQTQFADFRRPNRLFAAWSALVRSAEAEKPTKQERAKIDELRRRLVALQKAAYPKLRARFGKVCAEQGWIDNIECRVLGAGNRTVEFVAAPFAANRRIAEFHQGVEQTLAELRFTRAQYRWVKGADGYAYTLSAQRDDELTR